MMELSIQLTPGSQNAELAASTTDPSAQDSDTGDFATELARQLQATDKGAPWQRRQFLASAQQLAATNSIAAAEPSAISTGALAEGQEFAGDLPGQLHLTELAAQLPVEPGMPAVITPQDIANPQLTDGLPAGQAQVEKSATDAQQAAAALALEVPADDLLQLIGRSRDFSTSKPVGLPSAGGRAEAAAAGSSAAGLPSALSGASDNAASLTKAEIATGSRSADAETDLTRQLLAAGLADSSEAAAANQSAAQALAQMAAEAAPDSPGEGHGVGSGVAGGVGRAVNGAIGSLTGSAADGSALTSRSANNGALADGAGADSTKAVASATTGQQVATEPALQHAELANAQLASAEAASQVVAEAELSAAARRQATQQKSAQQLSAAQSAAAQSANAALEQRPDDNAVAASIAAAGAGVESADSGRGGANDAGRKKVTSSFVDHLKQVNQQMKTQADKSGQSSQEQHQQPGAQLASAQLASAQGNAVTGQSLQATGASFAAQLTQLHSATVQASAQLTESGPAQQTISNTAATALSSASQQALQKAADFASPLSLQQANAASQLTEKVVYQVNQKIQMAEIRIDPEDLGAMQIKVNLQHDQLSLQFTVQQAQAKEALEQHLPKLRELLEQQGLSLGESQIEQRNKDQQEQGRQFAGRNADGADGTADDGAGGQSGQVQLNVSDRMVDYYA